MEVSVTTLDEVVKTRGIDKLDVLKIDTETTEPAVLAGAAETLAKHRPAIFFEVLPGSGSGRKIEEQLRPLDYSFYLLYDTGMELQESIIEHPSCWNYLAQAKEG